MVKADARGRRAGAGPAGRGISQCFLLLIFMRLELTPDRKDCRSASTPGPEEEVDGSGNRIKNRSTMMRLGGFAKCALEEKPLLIISYEAIQSPC